MELVQSQPARKISHSMPLAHPTGRKTVSALRDFRAHLLSWQRDLLCLEPLPVLKEQDGFGSLFLCIRPTEK